MDDPIAFFITIATYGTWLPGDQRGWIEYKRGWQLPDPLRELDAEARMSDDACVLTTELRVVVEAQVLETCTDKSPAYCLIRAAYEAQKDPQRPKSLVYATA
jgi:hypothetical protein